MRLLEDNLDTELPCWITAIESGIYGLDDVTAVKEDNTYKVLKIEDDGYVTFNAKVQHKTIVRPIRTSMTECFRFSYKNEQRKAVQLLS